MKINKFLQQFYHEGKPLMDRNAVYIFICYFFALFSYPLVRSATQAIFYEAYTANDYPFATFITVVALAVVIFISNALQKHYGIHKIYLGFGIFSALLLWGSVLLFNMGMTPMAYVLFATKEIYIVLLIHLCMAFANGHFSLIQIKKLYGPMGALGSIGGIVGGQLTSYVAKNVGTIPVVYISLMAILLTSIIFYLTKNDNEDANDDVSNARRESHNSQLQYKTSPLAAIRNVTRYVALIAIIVSLSQFVIFVADLQFNIVFEQVVTSKNERTAYLGQIYSYINVGTLFLQFLVLPYILMRFKTRNILYFIPLFYSILIVTGMGVGVGSLWAIAGIFISMKATDYSLFAVAKEILYHPLTSVQKYGAKYITDIFIYRLSKGVIALSLSLVTVKSMALLNTIQTISILLWLLVIYLIYVEQKKLKINE